ncbi:aminopeptidase N [Plantactinospora sp. S1510]|uniref:Aminopeptidase N n=1 Tax=Plantactinospora alkalitolerans TaxID=2789879 RepID=A0ABS0H3S8_9ACTN|nr:aminopeptidase N [Plantactinospora alkalitolerans]MBF9133117.1 aminopeptidase N [Plantactinospora alkalitolerans]
MPSLSRVAATERAALLTVESYDIELDLTGGEAGFRSVTSIRFRSATPDAATFVEVRPARLLGVRLNGTELDPAALDDNQFALTGLLADNTLVVEAEMAYSNAGEGLHRFVDPADGSTYLYAMSAIDNAQRIFACFDQPDLKAPVTLSVVAPTDWTVAGNGELAASPAPGRWEFAATPPLATYVVSLIAGPYHVLRGEHDGIPLAVYCRRSLAGYLDRDADEIFTVTRQCLDRLHELFEVRYPFGKYDQAFVPEFNMGAMENPGLVTFRDDYLHRSVVTDAEREQRANTIAHEMAHMWFGDLVTLRWWDDLWLNESFAEYFGTRVTAEATRFGSAWTTFALRRKAWGYAADQRPSTHPVAPSEVSDVAEALPNLDGISYAKGASVLRQLVAWLGDEAFLAGLRGFFATHRFGNATLADLLAALSASSGRDLTGWAEVWLRQPQLNTLRAEVRLRDDGHYAEVAVVQTAPSGYPLLRPHRIAVGLYDLADLADTAGTGDTAGAGNGAGNGDGSAGTGSGIRLRRRIEVDLDPLVDGGRTVLDQLTGQPAARLLLPNDGDLTFAKVRLDDGSAAAVPLALPGLSDPLARALLWSETLDAVTDGERPVSDLVALIVAALPAEPELIVVRDVLNRTRPLLDRYLDPDVRAAAQEQLAGACDRLLAAAPPGSSRQLAAVRGLIGATVDTALLAGWLAGEHVPDGLVVDAELRWAVLRRLAVLGAVGEPEIAAEQAADPSATGAERAATCRAALPDPDAKGRVWQVVTGDTTLSNRLLEANATGFWQPEQTELTASYVERYFAEMPEAARRRTPWVADQVAGLAYPRYAVAGRTRELAAALLARDDLPAGLRRVVTDADDDLRRALLSRTLSRAVAR